MIRYTPDHFFSNPESHLYPGFQKNNRPDEKTFRDFLNSVTFPMRNEDAASVNIAGLIKIPTTHNVVNRNYTGLWPIAALVTNLPNVIGEITGNHVRVTQDVLFQGISVSRWLHDNQRLDFQIKASAKNSIEINQHSLQLKGDISQSPNIARKYYYGYDGANLGYHEFTIPGSIINPLINNNGVVTINNQFSTITIFDIDSAIYRGNGINLRMSSVNAVRNIRVEQSSAKVDLLIAAANNTNGLGGDVIIQSGWGSAGQQGGNIDLIATGNGNIAIGYNRATAMMSGRVGIGILPDNTDVLNIGGTARCNKIRVMNASQILSMSEVSASGRVLFLRNDGEIGFTTYALAKTKLSEESYLNNINGVLKPKQEIHAVDFSDVALETNALKVREVSVSSESQPWLAVIDADGTIMRISINSLKHILTT